MATLSAFQDALQYISPHSFYNLLQEVAISKIIVDTRKRRDFQFGKVRNAKNVPLEEDLDSEVSKKLKSFCDGSTKEGATELLDKLDDIYCKDEKHLSWRNYGCKLIVIYDLEGLDDGMAANLSRWIKLEGVVEKTYFLMGGYYQFCQKYPFLCSSNKKSAISGCMPAEIVEGFLYLGDYMNIKEKDHLKALSISHVVNMAEELDHPHEDTEEISCIKLGIDDVSSENLLKVLHNAVSAIEEARISNGRVIVHCNMGISRSSSVTIAYLMMKNRWGYEDAYLFVKSRRSCICPNPGFQKQLILYQDVLRKMEVHQKAPHSLYLPAEELECAEKKAKFEEE